MHALELLSCRPGRIVMLEQIVKPRFVQAIIYRGQAGRALGVTLWNFVREK
jgi:hypothetical protein